MFSMHTLGSLPVKHTRLLVASALAALITQINADSSGFTWLSPAPGATFQPGELIQARWSSLNAIDTPSFRLCKSGGVNRTEPSSANTASDDHLDDPGAAGSHPEGEGLEERLPTQGSTATKDNLDNGRRQMVRRQTEVGQPACGLAIWPDVLYANGSYSASLTVPKISFKTRLFLQVENDFGQTYASPSFSLSPSPAHSSSTANHVKNTSALTTHGPGVPVAAYTVPLSLLGVLILMTMVAFIVQRTRRAEQRAKASQGPTSRTSGTGGGGSVGLAEGCSRTRFAGHQVDIEKALVLADAMEVLAMRSGHNNSEPTGRRVRWGPRPMRPLERETSWHPYSAHLVNHEQPYSFGQPPSTRGSYGGEHEGCDGYGWSCYDAGSNLSRPSSYQWRRAPLACTPHTIPRGKCSASLSASPIETYPPSIPPTSLTINPPSTSASPTSSIPISRSSTNNYVGPSPAPSSAAEVCDGPQLIGVVDSPTRSGHPSLLTPCLGVPEKAMVNGEPPLERTNSLPRSLTERELYDQVRVVTRSC